jgi:hypothetical protein
MGQLKDDISSFLAAVKNLAVVASNVEDLKTKRLCQKVCSETCGGLL